jgi:hypothetical protein
MTLFLGYFLLDEAASRPTLEGAGGVINREGLLSVRTYRGARHGLVVASAAVAAPVAESQDGAVLTVLAGDPVWNLEGAGAGASDVEVLHAALQTRSCRDVLAESDGVCCGARLDRESLALFTDHSGAGPLYYAVVGGAVLFANCLRGVEYLGRGALSLNWSGVYQRIAFGHELGDATIYDGVRLLGPGEIVRFDRGERSVEHHADWEGIAEAQCTEEEAARAILDAFRVAVERCRRGRRRARAFLSGGLDSRLVTIVLREAGVELETFNFSREGTLERLLAREFAAVLGSTHREEQLDLRATVLTRIAPFAMFAARAIRDIPTRENETPEERWQGRRLWSGDNGSGHLGHVLTDGAMVRSLDEGGARQLLEDFPRLVRRVPEHLFRNGAEINRTVTDVFIKEIEGRMVRNEKRRLYLYFAINNLRKVLYSVFEEHDIHGIEMIVPFFNRKLLHLIMQTPLEYCLAHKLYNRMMTMLPDWTKTVPWQSYPGHEPCPLPVPKDAIYQWGTREASYYRLKRQAWRERGWQAMRQPIGGIVKKHVLLAYLLADLGMGRDYGYVMQAVDHIAAATASQRLHAGR